MPTRPVDAPLGDGTAEHVARGVGPAQDYKAATGTPVVAPFAADTVRSWTDAGGNTLTGYAGKGDYWVVQHLSQFRDDGHAAEGDLVALSGDTGAWTTGPHVHHYVVLGGIRYNPEDIGLYDPAPTPPPQEDDLPKYTLVKDDRGNFALVGPAGVGDIRSAAALRGAQKVARAANGGDLPEVQLSGEEWEAASLDAFK